jgi:hypothetical protein
MKHIKKLFNKLFEIKPNHYIGITCLNKLKYDLIKCPDFQRLPDHERITEIKEHISNAAIFPIITLEIGYLYNEFYLIDGQHRLAALKQAKMINYPFEVHLTMVNTNEELKYLFKLINKNTKIPDEWLLINNMNDVKKNMEEIFNNEMIQKIVRSTANPNRPHLSRIQLENMITNLYNENVIIKAVHFDELNEKYKTYAENNFPNTTGKQNDELLIKCHDLDCFLGMMIVKSDYEILKDNLIKIYKAQEINNIIYISKKQKIHQKIRTMSWEKYLKDTRQKTYDIKCPISICNNIINPHTFQCGHIISENNGGKIEITNLKPICTSCNGSMGIKNWDDYETSLNPL